MLIVSSAEAVAAAGRYGDTLLLQPTARLPWQLAAPELEATASVKQAPLAPLSPCSLALQPATEDGLEGSPRGALRRDLPPAVAALHRLTRLTALSLAAGAAEEPGDSWDDWD